MITARRVAVASLLLVMWRVAHVVASPAPACMPPPQAAPIPFEHVPPVLLRSFKERLGEISAPGGSFNATDVVWFESVPQRRFMFFWTVGRRWLIATERGGFAYSNPIFLYDLGNDERKADLIAEKDASSDTACAVALDLIAAP
jgi:hypothetical protein